MKNYKKAAGIIALAVLMLSITGCQDEAEKTVTDNTAVSETLTDTAGSTVVELQTEVIESDYDSEDSDSSWDLDSSTAITFSKDTIAVEGTGASVNENTVTINSAGTYILSGELADGQVVVEAEKEEFVKLVLNSVTLSCSDSSAIYIVQAEKVIMVLADNTQNTISDGEKYVYANAADDEPDASIFSKEDLSITGEGSLTVNGNYKSGIRSKDSLKVTAGNITVNAVKHGLVGKDDICIKGGSFNITSSEDAVHSKGYINIDGGSFTINAGDDGIHSDQYLCINDGRINIEKSYEGLEGLSIYINGGESIVNSSDDGMNAATPNSVDEDEVSEGQPSNPMDQPEEECYIVINGGITTVYAEGDGIDSNGYVIMNGGELYVDGPVNGGNGALDYNGTFVVTKGTLAAAGSKAMAQNISDTSSQSSVMLVFTNRQSAQTRITLSTPDGEEVFTYTPSKDFETLIVSSENLELNTTYKVTANGTELGELTLTKAVSALTEAGEEASVGMGGHRGSKSMGEGRMNGANNGNGEAAGGMPPSDNEMPSDMTPPQNGELPSDMTPPEGEPGNDMTTPQGTDTL